MRAPGRKGQAAVFVALCLMGLMLVVAYSVNTGIVVNDRIRMQSTADLATYAAAYSEAAALNEITKKNQAIADVARDCRRTLEHGGMPWNTVPCGNCNSDIGAEIALWQCRVELDLAVAQWVAVADYSSSVEPALDAGRATAEANFTGTGDKTSFMEDIFGSPTARWTYSTFWSTSFYGGITPTIADFRQVTDTAFNYQYINYCNSSCAPTLAVKPAVTIPTWFYKDDRDPDVWVAGRVMGTPEKRFLDTSYGTGSRDGGYFGASSTGGDDVLVAYAVAKPYDGSVGPSTGTEGNTRTGNTLVGLVYPSASIRFPKLTMYDEYRARMAGIQDNLTGGLAPTTLISRDGARLGKSWDTSKFEH